MTRDVAGTSRYLTPNGVTMRMVSITKLQCRDKGCCGTTRYLTPNGVTMRMVSITKLQCRDKGCCWDESVPNSKWCYYENGEYNETTVS